MNKPDTAAHSDIDLAAEDLPDFVDDIDSAPGLLSLAKSQWLFGDWEELASLGRDELKKHPHRDRLALLVSSANAQVGRQDEARELARLALSWGCPGKLVAEVLIAGVHNTLGRAAALRKDKAKMTAHFKASLSMVHVKAQANLITQTRAIRQVSQLGLIPQVSEILGDAIGDAKKLPRPSQRTRAIETIERELARLKDRSVVAVCGDEQSATAPANAGGSQPAKPPKVADQLGSSLLDGLTLTEISTRRWAFFFKIEELQLAVLLETANRLKPAVFLDIGANVGFYSLLVAKFIPQVPSIAFEPSPESFASLSENIHSNKLVERITPRCLALSNAQGLAEFGDFGECSGKNGILDTSIHELDQLSKKFSVATDTLDNLYPQSFGTVLVKVDTEGHEEAVLVGSEAFMKQNQVVLQIETGHKQSELVFTRAESLGLNHMFTLGPDSYFTNIKSFLSSDCKAHLLAAANEFIIGYRWGKTPAINRLNGA